MATTSSTFNYKKSGRLIGAGLDIEQIHRFNSPLFSGLHPFPFLFSKKEYQFCDASKSRALVLCAAFCAKEALFKAIGKPYAFSDCQLFWDGKSKDCELQLSKNLKTEFGITEALVQIKKHIPQKDYLSVSVFLIS
jgi:phosphopantetheine--protein transferase-like protein